MQGISIRRLLIVVALMMIGSTTAQAQTGSITGRVTESGNGRPVVNARVQASSAGRRTTAVYTGENGDYRISGLAEGAYSVIVTRIGYSPRTVATVQVGTGAASADVSLVLAPSQLQQEIITASRAPEKVIDAPASVSVVSAVEINERPSINVADHVVALPGIDVARGGIMQSNIVARGFNNIFSGALLTLTDNRFAFVPSLRVNIPYLSPTTNEDIERIEVVLGPGAALYGPNTASGVMHIITKSPFTTQGTTLTVDGGNQSLFRGAFRHAGSPNEKFGYKLSYDFFSADEWPEFQRDTLERRVRETRVKRHGGEARVDFRPTAASELIFNYGRAMANSAVEPTGLGPAQIKDWIYQTFQARGRVNRLFGQLFYNSSDAGGTYLLRTVAPGSNCPSVADPACIIDQSRQLVGQLQHGRDFGARQRFLYGFDYLRTEPRTGGTINGRNDADDKITETGGYLHSVTTLSRLFEFTAAARVDKHSRLEDAVFSPRLALVFKPQENQNLRLTYNRAFSTPSTVNLFLDLVAGRLPATGTQLFGVRALGVPKEGLSFKRDCAGGAGNLCMRVGGFPGTTSALTPAVAAPYYPFAVGAAAPGLVAGLTAAFTAQGQSAAQAAGTAGAIVNFLGTLRPTPTDVGTKLRVLNTENSTFRDVAPTDLKDIERLKPTIHSTIEAGYKGILGERFQLGVDVWHEQRRNFVGPLIVETPNVFLDAASLGGYLVPRLTAFFQAAGQSAAQAAGTAAALAPTIAGALGGVSEGKTTGVPLGVVNFQEALSSGSDIIVTYRNFGKLNVWGSDLSGEFLLDRGWSVQGTYSYVNKNFFPRSQVGGVQDIALNAPASKGSLAARYRDDTKGISGELRGRHVASFPVFSFINGTIETYNLVDANVAFRPQVLRGGLFSLSATNLFDNKHREFVGGGRIGRLVMTRLQYTF